MALSAPFIWLGFLATELLVFVLSQWRYHWWVKKDREENDSEKKVLYLSLRPEDAVEASRMLRNYAKENGIQYTYANTLD